MKYRSRSTEPRTIIAKFAGTCACCAGAIKPGDMIDYYPATKRVAHLHGLEGNSARCAMELSSKRDHGYVDPGELASDRWNETHY